MVNHCRHVRFAVIEQRENIMVRPLVMAVKVSFGEVSEKTKPTHAGNFSIDHILNILLVIRKFRHFLLDSRGSVSWIKISVINADIAGCGNVLRPA